MVHDEARGRLLERLDWMRIEPGVALDVGCATGLTARALAERFPNARVLGLDWSAAMLGAARAESAAGPPLAWVRAAAERLPLRAGSVDLAVLNLSLPWCDPRAVFAELARVIAPGGLVLFATLGPDTAAELRRAWRTADDALHVHAFVDMHDIGDLLVAAGLAEPVLDVDAIELSYGSVDALVRDFRAWGAVNVAAGRRKTLTGPRRWRRFAGVLDADAPFSVTIELGLGHAWGTGLATQGGGDGEFALPADAIRRRRRQGPPNGGANE